ncbi:TetR/AcrR family transcriptional regulator [Patulibacter americanus]|uniref:TetR/AcrR family transcriptional regulator n=1 Tax=Patulibacter americanus TaxID=588672 RepID=UPI0003B43AA8|nr:TetR/AcrR family transcriptional regulator [Patulibacter americanus]
MGTSRMTREERRADTRRRLLDAAADVFARHGYHASSVDAVAEAAGFTTGAVYSAFGSKEELFLAVVDEHLRRSVASLEAAVAPGETVAARVRVGAEHWMQLVERTPEMLLLHTEFWAYAVRDPRVRPRVAAQFAEVRAALCRLLVAGADELGLRLTMPVEEVAVGLDALADGIARQRLAQPDAVPHDLFGRLVGAFLSSVSEPRDVA